MRKLVFSAAARGPLVAAALLGALLLSACNDGEVQSTGCAQDSDCVRPGGGTAAAYRCEPLTGECYCRTNDACSPREFCNTAGFCQDKSGCEKNEDCIGGNLFCDTTSGTCLTLGRCSSDLHCPLGQICQDTSCVEGCRADGDCPGTSCRCGDAPCACTGTTQAELEACHVGVCDPNFCSNDTFCAYGEICGAPADAGTGPNQCYSDYDPQRRPYCDRCTGFKAAGDPECGRGPNYCLVDTANGGFFCGADCSEGQTCPRGYQCSEVIVVGLPGTPQCSRTVGCPINTSIPCQGDGGCPRGGTCFNGFCAGLCAIGENETVGFCTCIADTDCPGDTCSGGACAISGKPCGTDQDCRTIRCVDFGGAGGCYIGDNCAPANGLTCLDVGGQN